MKKYILISIMILICIIILKSCLSSEPEKLISPEIVQSIISITDGNKYVSITETEYDNSLFRIQLDFLREAESYEYVQAFTDAVCEDCYKILKRHNIERSISVWGRYPRGTDLITMYGRTYYDKYSGKFEFKTAKELNL